MKPVGGGQDRRTLLTRVPAHTIRYKAYDRISCLPFHCRSCLFNFLVIFFVVSVPGILRRTQRIGMCRGNVPGIKRKYESINETRMALGKAHTSAEVKQYALIQSVQNQTHSCVSMPKNVTIK